MANLQETISAKFPEATFGEGEILPVNIPDAKLHDLVKWLRDEQKFDFLVTIVGHHHMPNILWESCIGTARCYRRTG